MAALPEGTRPPPPLDYASPISRQPESVTVRRILAGLAAAPCFCFALFALLVTVEGLYHAATCDIRLDRVDAYWDGLRWGVSCVILSIPTVRWGRFALIGPPAADVLAEGQPVPVSPLTSEP